jgi:hypothetical protein
VRSRDARKLSALVQKHTGESVARRASRARPGRGSPAAPRPAPLRHGLARGNEAPWTKNSLLAHHGLLTSAQN